MLLFRSEEHAERRYEAGAMATGAFLTLDQQWRLAKAWYENRMAPDWRRRTPEEARAVFESIGLTGEFWRV